MAQTGTCAIGAPAEVERDEGLRSWGFSRLYAFMLSLLGFYYGVGICLFATAFNPFMLKMGRDPTTPSATAIHGKLNAYYAAGRIAASLVSSPLYEKFGRYRLKMAALVLGALVHCAMAHKSLHGYYALRLLSGLVGYLWVFLASVIMSEYLPERVENAFNPFLTAMISIGATFACAFYLPFFVEHWPQLMFGLAALELLKLAFFARYRMESPLWMAQRGRTPCDIAANCRLLYTPAAAARIAAAVTKRAGAERAKEEAEEALMARDGLLAYYRKTLARFLAENRAPLFLVVLGNVYNQLCGSVILECYSDHIFEQEGIALHSHLTLIQGVVSIVAGVGVFFATPLTGKRNMLMAGFAGMMGGYSLYMAGTVFHHKSLVAAGILAAFFFYCVSLGGVRFSYNPAILGGHSLSVCALLEQVISCVLARTSKRLIDELTPLGVFFAVQLCSVACAVPFVLVSRGVKERTMESV